MTTRQKKYGTLIRVRIESQEKLRQIADYNNRSMVATLQLILDREYSQIEQYIKTADAQPAAK